MTGSDDIATIAGNGNPAWNGGEGPLAAFSAAIRPNGLAIDDEGNLFIKIVFGGDRVLFLNFQDTPIPVPGQRGVLLPPNHLVSVVGTSARTGSIDGEGGEPS